MIAVCEFGALLAAVGVELLASGLTLPKLRNVRHAEQLRHVGSEASLIACKYASKPLLRDSINAGLDVVLLNHDLCGKPAGGAIPLH